MTPPTRAEQRRRSEEAILDAARGLFAELGYDRTTIRGVAKAAGVDPGLVMHYYGSKENLFARATEEAPPREAPPREAPSGEAPSGEHAPPGKPTPPGEPAPPGEPTRTGKPAGTGKPTPPGEPTQTGKPARTGEMVETLLSSLTSRLESEPLESLALLRSMLTNQSAADRYRSAAHAQLGQISAAIPAADADLRASLLSAIVHGIIIDRYLLGFGHLADAAPEQIADLLRPCFEALAAAPDDRIA
ncbi:TetR family transcriptional regulator [Actinoplanes sp. NPDC051861]|uniref:TetR/AcrR family transcriptional regulator n=1 Tax=Actinoplanes sp. NPDC051861 TaxID=3155170 RepID=UPI003420A9C3